MLLYISYLFYPPRSPHKDVTLIFWLSLSKGKKNCLTGRQIPENRAHRALSFVFEYLCDVLCWHRLSSSVSFRILVHREELGQIRQHSAGSYRVQRPPDSESLYQQVLQTPD